MSSSSPHPPKPSRVSAAAWLVRSIKEFDIMGLLPWPKLAPSDLLVSDAVGLLLYALYAADWSSSWKYFMFRVVPFSRTVFEALDGFWSSFWQERWHAEDLLEERARRWCPHLYKTSPPRLRSYREILNRQQALRNCCGAQLCHLDTREVVSNMLLQVALAACWAWALLRDHLTLIWLLAEVETKAVGYRQTIEDLVPPVVRKGEGIMPVDHGGRPRRCLNRIQQRIDRGQVLITRFLELGLCQIDQDDGVWDETEWLIEKDGDVPADMPDKDRFLVYRVVFSAGLSWWMVSISCDFATFYLVVLALRLRSRLLGW